MKRPRSFHNIEKSFFHRGEYVGYGAGTWRIFRWSGQWRAVRQDLTHRTFTAKNLQTLSQQLEKERLQCSPIS